MKQGKRLLNVVDPLRRVDGCIIPVEIHIHFEREMGIIWAEYKKIEKLFQCGVSKTIFGNK